MHKRIPPSIVLVVVLLVLLLAGCGGNGY